MDATAGARSCVLLVLCLATAVSAACPSNCSGKGDCNVATGRCLCADGWLGADCSLADPACTVLLKNCSGHGLCHGRQCKCNVGWGGPDCSVLVTHCTRNCSGHGRCIAEADGVERCHCDEGHGGDACDTVVPATNCPNNCSGHGSCVNGSCQCFPGFWSGPACDQELTMRGFFVSNCSGHGLCGPFSLTELDDPSVCNCLAGFCGDACDELCGTCERNCTGHGVCVGTMCRCDVGFAGSDCSMTAAVVGCPNNCTGHGRCIADGGGTRCHCDHGYRSVDCSRVSNSSACPDHCSGKGECLPDGCHCYEGFGGESCNQVRATCEVANHCSGNGECVNGVCQCFDGFRGFDCTSGCFAGGIGRLGCYEDLERGLCVNGSCVCKPEWTGEWCQQDGVGDLWEEYRKGYNPLGSSLMLGEAAVAGAMALGVLGLVATKANQALKKRSKRRKGGLLDKGFEVTAKPGEFGS